MKSYTTGRNLYGAWTKNTATANLAFGDQMANDDYRALCALKDWPFLERSRTLSTVASTQFGVLPYDCDQVREISVVPNGSSIRYVPKLSPSQAHWDHLNLTVFNSDIPQWYFVLNGQLGLWPRPSSTGNTITVIQKTRVVDLSVADYTTGNIVSIANGAAAVVGSGTTWTSQMVGRFLRITLSDTANTGDGVWYEISAVPSATTMTLVRMYGGASIVAGSAAYTIGQMPLLPEAYQDMPWMYAAGMYWSKETDKRAGFFLSQHGESGGAGRPATGKVRELIGAYSSPTTDMVLDDGGEHDIINPNLTISI
jgi:hypothetical protein